MTKAINGPLRIVIEGDAEQPVRQITGRLLSGHPSVGDMIVISPANHEVRIEAIETKLDIVHLLLDRDVEFSAPALVSHNHDLPVETDVFLIDFIEKPQVVLVPGQKLIAKTQFNSVEVLLQSVDFAEGNVSLPSAVVRAEQMLVIDTFSQNPVTALTRLFDNDVEIAVGRISMKGYADQRDLMTARATNITRVTHRVTARQRANKCGHEGAVIWLTGLSGSGKSTLAVELEKELFNRDFQAYVLDGDNVRHGLNANLGFTPEDRSENIRRVGEVAALFSSAGFIAISAFISPYRSDRDRARAAAGDGFHEIYVSAGLDICESRDPKGLYKRARAGEIPDFTGISAPYEVPEAADLIVDTELLNIAQCVGLIVEYVEKSTVRNES